MMRKKGHLSRVSGIGSISYHVPPTIVVTSGAPNKRGSSVATFYKIFLNAITSSQCFSLTQNDMGVRHKISLNTTTC